MEPPRLEELLFVKLELTTVMFEPDTVMAPPEPDACTFEKAVLLTLIFPLDKNENAPPDPPLLTLLNVELLMSAVYPGY